MDKSKKPREPAVEAVVGVFDDPSLAAHAARQLRKDGIEFKRVTESSEATEGLLGIAYEDVDVVNMESVSKGIGVGGGLGAAAGLVLMAVPGLGFAAPIAGFLGGALIGGMAGIDESVRAIELPAPIDYSAIVAEGKSLLAISGDESQRLEYAKMLDELGAIKINQHPPTQEAVRGKISTT